MPARARGAVREARAVEVADMVASARLLFDVLRQSAANGGTSAALSERAHVLHRNYELSWLRVREHAKAFDTMESQQSSALPATYADAELSGLRQERSQLRRALADRNRDLKQQIDNA